MVDEDIEEVEDYPDEDFEEDVPDETSPSPPASNANGLTMGFTVQEEPGVPADSFIEPLDELAEEPPTSHTAQEGEFSGTGQFSVQQELEGSLPEVELLKEFDLRARVSAMRSDVHARLTQRDFDSAALEERSLDRFLEAYLLKCQQGKQQAADAEDFSTALELEKCSGVATSLKTAAKFSKAAGTSAQRISELLSKFVSESKSNGKKMAAASANKNYREAKRLKDSTAIVARETRKRTTDLYTQAVSAGGSTAAFKFLWESIQVALPKEDVGEISQRSEGSNASSKGAKGWGAASRVVKAGVVAKKLNGEATGNMISRLHLKPKRSSDEHGSADVMNNCTFKLNLKEVRASVVPVKRQGKWQPPAKGWKPGNAPVTQRSSQDGLYSIRARAALGGGASMGNTMGNTMRSTSGR
eukprot:TRINITY_DN9479_c0_g1_i2.p1 TRINITY_DN9479_c0_g1~~TRINITY_DN9479_c0_g1_i2.p1  ORF type:complete len:414 (-),score=94.32 TRINITY_DN9479_c0_g1_i2:332-1573(-)